MARNGKISEKPDEKIVGDNTARNHFFPKDTNILNGFVYVYGTIENVQKYLDGFKVVPYDLK